MVSTYVYFKHDIDFTTHKICLLFSLMNHCQRVSTKSKSSDSSFNSNGKKATNSRGANSIPFCKKHQAHHHAMTTSTNVSSDNNGVKICCTNEENYLIGNLLFLHSDDIIRS